MAGAATAAPSQLNNKEMVIPGETQDPLLPYCSDVSVGVQESKSLVSRGMIRRNGQRPAGVQGVRVPLIGTARIGHPWPTPRANVVNHMAAPESDCGLRSLHLRTNLIFHRYHGIVTDHGEFVSIETPDNPGYYWGNCLVFRKPPAPGDAARWREAFHQRFGSNPSIQHETFTWDNPQIGEPALEPFLEQGFGMQRHVVMTAERLIPKAKQTLPLVLRPFARPEDWEQAVENDVLIKAAKYGAQQYREYRTRKNLLYQNMIAEGLGLWFGAFLKDKLVGDLGLFREATIGRFQIVNTHPDYRRQGICSRLMYFAGEYGTAEMGLRTLVIVADGACIAKDVYAALGFRIVEQALGLEKRPGTDQQQSTKEGSL